MKTRHGRMNNILPKLMATVAGALLAPAFAYPPPPPPPPTSPFNGAFVEGALGGSSNSVKLKTVSQSLIADRASRNYGMPNAPGHSQSISSNQSKSVFAGRVGLGYGYDLPFGIDYTRASPRFNLTGMLTYSAPQKVDAAGSKIKNSVGLLFQPGYYLPLKSNSVMIYGTVGYAKASFDKKDESITITDTELAGVGNGSTYNSPPLGGGSFRADGLILGLGAKYAVTSRLYAGLDYAHTDYQEKSGRLWNWQDPNGGRTPNGNQATEINTGTDWRVKFKTDTFLLTIGYRFF